MVLNRTTKPVRAITAVLIIAGLMVICGVKEVMAQRIIRKPVIPSRKAQPKLKRPARVGSNSKRPVKKGIASSTDQSGNLKLKLRDGARLYQRHGDFDLVANITVNPNSSNKRVKFNWDVSKLKFAKGVRWEVSDQPFVTHPRNSRTRPRPKVATGTGKGKFGLFEVDFGSLDSYPPKGKPFYVRVVPVYGSIVAGNPSNVMQVFYGHGPKSPPTKFKEGLNLVKFTTKLHTQLNNDPMGYQLVISRPGAVTRNLAGGFARFPYADGRRVMKKSDRMNIASLNKTITAVATLQAIAERKTIEPQISIDSKIHRYLPKHWEKGANIDRITFRELLTHQSGIRIGDDLATDYSDLRRVIKAGVRLSDRNKYQYKNHNFALLRVIIPYLQGYKPPETPLLSDYSEGSKTANRYLQFLNQKIFQPAGISTVGATPPANKPVLYYPKKFSNQSGYLFQDFRLKCGGGCLQMTASELNKFLHALNHTNKLLTTNQLIALRSGQLGTYRSNVTGGRCYSHSGDLNRTKNGTSFEQHSFMASFSDGTQVSIIVNSSVKVRLNDMVRKAYQESWGL